MNSPGVLTRSSSKGSALSSLNSKGSPVQVKARTYGWTDGPENVFFFIPNLIGYSRILLAVISLYYMPAHSLSCMILYIISQLLDALDGLAARHFNQSTRFGAVLDMVTDRCTTSCLLCYLCSAYPPWTWCFQALVSLDLASHYMHMYATLREGGESHKIVTKERSKILNLYYSSNKVLFSFCAGNELFLVCLYLLSFPPRSAPIFGDYAIPESLASFVTGPQTHNKVFKGSYLNISWPLVLATLSSPIFLAKQLINIIQLSKASQRLATADLKERSAKREKK